MPRAGRNLLIECADEYNERVVFNLSPHLLAFARWVPTPRAAVPLLAAPLLLAALSACGDDRPPPPPTDMMITFDAGDGGMIVDVDAQAKDLGGMGVDGGGGGGPCHVEGAVLTLATDTTDRTVRLVDVAVSASTFVVAWTDARSAVGDAYVYAWPAADATGLEHRVTDDFALTREPHLGARTDGFTVGWVDNTTGTFELFARPLDAAGIPSGAAQRLTNNALREDSPRVAGLGGTATMFAWLESDGSGGPTVTHALPLDATGAAVGAPTLATAAPRHPSELTLSRLGTGAALAWNEDGTVYLQRLTSAGVMAGAAAAINTEANASGSAALALDATGGGVAFGVRVAGARAEIRMRTVGPTGATVGAETILTAPPATGADPMIAAYASGYAVAYRATAADGTSAIRVAFATATGEYSSSLDVAATTATGGAPHLAVAPDGRILVAWMDANAPSADVRAAKVICE